MFPFYNVRDETFAQDIARLTKGATPDDSGLTDRVRDILQQVRTRGDDAVLEYTRNFDNFPATDMADLYLNKKQLAEHLHSIDSAVREALEQAIDRVHWFHEQQKESSWTVRDEFGNLLGQRITPLASAGLYVPGGRAAYPSSVIMNAIPARVAGVQQLVMTMPSPKGILDSPVLAAAALCDIDGVFLIGGAQAIAAMAWGTESVPKVDKITGPGNAYVAEAKRQVFGYTGIDMIAGPSEIVVISDGSCDPNWVALDVCAQAEHDPDARSILLSDNEQHIRDVIAAITRQLETLPRKQIITESLSSHGAFVLCRDIQHACDIANDIAPEHLELLVEEPEQYQDSIIHAGALFIGPWSCEAFGDYCAGPNHVLPTMTSARFSSPLGVYDFIKRSSYIHCQPDGVASIARTAAILAEQEGLQAHARSASIRGAGT